MPSACSVSGNIQDLTGTGQAGFAVFFLENYSTNIPRVIGTTNLCSKQVTLAASSSGVISGTIWGNDNIDPAGTFYSLAIQDQGRNLIAYYAFNITGGSFNLNSATPITTAPVVASPTGDTTYLRLDGGNSSSATDPFSFAKQLLLTRLTNQIVTGSAGNQTTLNFPASASNVTLAFPSTADTVIGRATTDTLTNKTLTSPVLTNPQLTASSTVKDSTGNTSMGVTAKNGSAGGNYTTTSASYADMDGTNLAFTVTVPTGWKAIIHATMYGNNGTVGAGMVAISDGASVLRETLFGTAGTNAPIGLHHVLSGDGASHTFKLQFKATAGTTTIVNTTAVNAPLMSVTLIPSN